KSGSAKKRLRRWALLFGLVLVLSGLVVGSAGIIEFQGEAPPVAQSNQCQNAWKAPNPVAAENTCVGTTAWRPDHPIGQLSTIEAFTNPVSVEAGQGIQIYVSTTAKSYSFQVFRMGWYQGLGGHLLYSSAVVPGIQQPKPTIDPATRMVSCDNW